MDLEQHFQQFVQAGLYLRGWSPKTASLYRQAFTCLQRFHQSLRGAQRSGIEPEVVQSVDGPLVLTKAQLEAWVVWMRQNGRTPAGCNMCTCVFNSFCSWLKEQGLLKQTITIEKIKDLETDYVVVSVSASMRILQFSHLRPSCAERSESPRKESLPPEWERDPQYGHDNDDKSEQ